jgi:hypothetical protein
MVNHRNPAGCDLRPRFSSWQHFQFSFGLRSMESFPKSQRSPKKPTVPLTIRSTRNRCGSVFRPEKAGPIPPLTFPRRALGREATRPRHKTSLLLFVRILHRMKVVHRYKLLERSSSPVSRQRPRCQGIPPGTYIIAALHPKAGELVQELTVVSGGQYDVSFTFP